MNTLLMIIMIIIWVFGVVSFTIWVMGLDDGNNIYKWISGLVFLFFVILTLIVTPISFRNFEYDREELRNQLLQSGVKMLDSAAIPHNTKIIQRHINIKDGFDLEYYEIVK